MSDRYWTLVSRDECGGYVSTYEHRLPHGTLVLVVTSSTGGTTSSVVFVPAAPPPGSERP